MFLHFKFQEQGANLMRQKNREFKLSLPYSAKMENDMEGKQDLNAE